MGPDDRETGSVAIYYNNLQLSERKTAISTRCCVLYSCIAYGIVSVCPILCTLYVRIRMKSTHNTSTGFDIGLVFVFSYRFCARYYVYRVYYIVGRKTLAMGTTAIWRTQNITATDTIYWIIFSHNSHYIMHTLDVLHIHNIYILFFYTYAGAIIYFFLYFSIWIKYYACSKPLIAIYNVCYTPRGEGS